MSTLEITPPAYTVAEAAALLGRSPFTLRDQVTRGEVPHHRTGRVKGVYFTDGDIDQIRSSDARPVQHAPSRNEGRPRRAGTPTAPVVIPEEFARLKQAR